MHDFVLTNKITFKTILCSPREPTILKLIKKMYSLLTSQIMRNTTKRIQNTEWLKHSRNFQHIQSDVDLCFQKTKSCSSQK